MNVFTKYLLRSISEKKGRTILLLISIAISVALLVGSMGAIKAVLGTFSSQIKENCGEFNIMVTASKNSSTPLFDPEIFKDKNITTNSKFATMGGYLTSDSEKSAQLLGTNLKDLEGFKSLKYIDKKDLEPFTGNKALISKRISDSLKLKTGDELKVTILNKEYTYKIVGILSNNAMMLNDDISANARTKSFTIITPENNVFDIYGEKNKYTQFWGSYSGKDIKTWVKDFNNEFKSKNIKVSEIFDEKTIEDQLSTMRIPLYFMLVIVLIMTTFIIYSSFNLIITERLSIIGTFLSQGATKGGIILILLKESLLYGIIGGIIGDLLGGGLTYGISYLANPLREFGIPCTPNYYPLYFIIGFLFAILLSVGSSLLPILRTRKLPVKDVILNTLSTSAKISYKGFIAGLILVLISVAIHFTGTNNKYALASPALFVAFIGVMLMIPKVIDVTLYPLVRFFRNVSGLSMLSFNNVRTSKVLINNIRLIAVSVISIIMMISLKTTMVSSIEGVFKALNYDVDISCYNPPNKKFVDDTIRNYENTKNVITQTYINGTLNNDDSKIITLSSVDPKKYIDFEDYTSFGDRTKELTELADKENGVIISKQTAGMLKIKKGDTITVDVNGAKADLKVLSIFNPKLMNPTAMNLISLSTAEKCFNIKYPASYSITVKNDVQDAKKYLDKKLKGLNVVIQTKDENVKQSIAGTKIVVQILSFFCYAAMLIGSFGIISNVSISFIQRKREMAVMSSVGLTKSSRSFMLLLEGIFQGVFGTFVSLVAAYGINLLFKDVFTFLGMDLDLVFPYKESIYILVIITILMILASLSSVFKSNKLQIVKELKYE